MKIGFSEVFGFFQFQNCLPLQFVERLTGDKTRCLSLTHTDIEICFGTQ